MHQRAKILVLEEQDSYDAAIERLIGVLCDSQFPVNDVDPFLLRMEVRFPGVHVLSVLHQSQSAEKFYWSDRNRTVEWIGLGAAIKNPPLVQMREVLDALGGEVQFFGAMRFDPAWEGVDALWTPFAETCFVLPTFELRIDEAGAKIALNIVASSTSHLDRALSLLRDLVPKNEPAKTDVPFAHVVRESRLSSLEEWKEKVDSSVHRIATKGLDKIVLANANDFWFDGPIDPVKLLMRLDARSPSTYRFFMQLSPHCAFLGASPEQLFARNGFRIESEAQAGTRPRGKSEAEDAALALELLESQKEYVEHDLVCQDVEKSLSDLCRDSGWIDQRTIIKLSHVQHLRSRFGGILNEGVSDSQILEALHPTPAVCGWPTKLAQSSIRELESFDRGYYCGPIGMIGRNKTEFAVALRSALVTDCHLRVFAGAGLVKGSHAEDEWNEIDAKMRLYYDVLKK